MRKDLILEPWHIKMRSNDWVDDYAETIFSLGNGRIGCRGYIPFEPKNRPIQQGLFLAGTFGEIKPGITDFVNLPTPVFDRILINGKPGRLTSEIVRDLDLEHSILTFEFTLNDTIQIKAERFFSSDDVRFMIQRFTIKAPSNVSITIDTGINEASCNCPVPDDQVKENTETINLSKRISLTHHNDSLIAKYLITGTHLEITEQLTIHTNDFEIKHTNEALIHLDAITDPAASNDITTYSYEKFTQINSSRDINLSDSSPDVISFQNFYNKHLDFWKEKWDICDIDSNVIVKKFEDSAKVITALRYNIFQLINNCSRLDPTVSIGARGLTHTRYKGCYFWDTDIFMLPFYLATDKEAAKNLCMYRINNLDAARDYAKKMNLSGARFPWMTSFDGSEQCETWDIGCSEIHITADVVYAINNYIQKYNDQDFYINHAAELYIETARYWLSRYTYDSTGNTANLLFCKGPDEYCGITTNNLFTNVMVQHNLRLAIKAASDLKQDNTKTYNRLNISDSEIKAWSRLEKDIPWPRDPESGHLTTDDTFHLLEKVDISKLKPDDSASYHTTCFDRLQRYKVVKQADVILLMTRLPELFSKEERLTAWNDFEPLCLHDSTLSFASHALFAVQNGITDKAMYYFNKALFLDIYDVMNNTGKEGLHMAGMGEIWNAAYFMGLLKLKP
jgi:kojibiose phosphorylase